jgi:hypothetical protein
MFKGAMEAGGKLLSSPRASAAKGGLFKALGTPSVRAAVRGQNLNAAQIVARGRTRAIYGGAALGVGLGANSLMAPRYSSGKQGIYPRSTGGYA